MRRWTVWEWLVWLFGFTICLGLIMWFSYAVWGPHYPPKPFNAKEEFVRQCTAGDYDHVPNTGSDNWKDWTCAKK